MKISIIMASYNYAQYLEEAINSVINQSYSDWELIIADDGSSDNSLEIIKSYCQKDSRIKLFQHENGENRGLKETILLALKNVSGDWVAFLESDDYLASDYLEAKVEATEKNPEVKLIFNKVSFVSQDVVDSEIKLNAEKKQAQLAKIKFPRKMFYDFYVRNMILTFSCVMVETNTLKNADFNTPIDALLDWWLWINMSYKNKFYYIDKELTFWRLHKQSYICQNDKAKRFLLPRKAYLKKFLATFNLKIPFYSIASELYIFLIKLFK